MGVVYRAHDESLERDVAIKVLPAGLLAEPEARKQFRKEALILSRLNHPNIGTVYEFDTREGIDFLVLELVPGETLTSRIARGPPTEEEVGRLGEQLAQGLAAAHRIGILHRDIKPANLRLTLDGTLKILDFGLARLHRRVTDLTTTESVSAGYSVAGTLPYMSPEQLRRSPLDPRSDIHAAGAVLYEMACGRRAFPQEEAAAVIAAILGETPTPPSRISPGVSGDLERVILRCLEKEPGRRYAGADELTADLRQLLLPPRQRRGVAVAARKGGFRAVPRVARIAVPVLLTAALLVSMNFGGLRHRLFRTTGPTAIPSLAVLPLANLSGDPGQEYFADGMTDELITRLAQIGAMRVISRSSVMEYKGAKKPAAQVARELGVKMLVQGTVQRAGDRVRIRAQLVEAATDRNLWADSFDRSASDVLAIQSEVARAIVNRIQVQLTPRDQARLARAQAVRPDAHDAYLRGRYALSRLSGEDLGSAVEFFTRAVRLEPGYAQAWAGLAHAYTILSSIYVDPAEAIPKARAAAQRAIALDPDLAEPHATLAWVAVTQDRDPKTADQELQQAIRLNPNSAEVRGAYAGGLQITGQLDRAQVEWDRARALDPLSTMLANNSIWCLYLRGRYDEALERLSELVRMAPGDAQTWLNLGRCYVQKGQHDQAIAAFRKAESLADAPWPLGMLGYAYAAAGRTEEARAVLDRMKDASQKSRLPPSLFATVYAGLGDRDRCFEWLETAYDIHDDNLNNLKIDPVFKSVRSDPRFRDLVSRLGLNG